MTHLWDEQIRNLWDSRIICGTALLSEAEICGIRRTSRGTEHNFGMPTHYLWDRTDTKFMGLARNLWNCAAIDAGLADPKRSRLPISTS